MKFVTRSSVRYLSKDKLNYLGIDQVLMLICRVATINSHRTQSESPSETFSHFWNPILVCSAFKKASTSFSFIVDILL